MSEHRDDDPGGLGFLDDMIEAVRSEEPAELEWEDAKGRLFDRIQTRAKECTIMTVIRRTRPTRLGWAVSATVAAAVVLLAVGIIFWGRRPALAFSDVLEQIRASRPYACTETVENDGKPPENTRVIRLDLSHRREILPSGSIRVFDLSEEPMRILVLIPDRKLAIETTLTGIMPRTDPDWLTTLARMRSGLAEDLGTREIDDQNARGFHRPDEINDLTIWANVDTGLPIRLELVQPTINRKVTMTDFRFDGEFDKSLFSTTAPEGYEVRKVVKDGTTPTEEDLIEGLRAVAEFLDRKFPPDFSYGGIVGTVREHIRDSAPGLSKEELAGLTEKIQRAVRFTMILETFRQAEDLSYSGEGVRLGDKDSPVFRWLPKDSQAYRVIFGDLSIRDVPKDEVASPAEKR